MIIIRNPHNYLGNYLGPYIVTLNVEPSPSSLSFGTKTPKSKAEEFLNLA